MATIKDRFDKWKKNRSVWQKGGDILFWLLLILMLFPGPRKTISTTVNKIFLHVRAPRASEKSDQPVLSENDYAWTFLDANGNKASLENFKNKVIFLNFWATWCPPCIAEMPEIQKLYNKFGDKVEFVLLTNESPEKVMDFLSAREYDLPVYFGISETPDILASRAIPQTFIISRNGRIVVQKTGAANWDSKATSNLFRELLP